MPTKTQFGHGLAKVLGITLETPEDDVTRGESVFSVETADTFIEQPPTTAEWLTNGVPSADDVVDYVKSLFPFLTWIRFYNLQWLLGDLVAGEFVPALIQRNFQSLFVSRNYRRHYRYSPGYGICKTCLAPCRVWVVLVLHWRSLLLVLCHLERYHHRCRYKKDSWSIDIPY